MSDLDQIEDRLRNELRSVDARGIDTQRVLVIGHRRRGAERSGRRAALGLSVAVLAGVGALVIRTDDRPDAVTDSPDITSTTVDLPDDVPLGEDTTWPGGPFDPIEGMVAVPGAEPLSDEEEIAVYNAEVRLTSACMASRGYAWGTGLGAGTGGPARYLSPDELRAGGFDYDYDWYAAGEAFLGNSDGSPDGWTDPTADMTADELAAYDAALSGPQDPDVEIETHDGTTSTSSTGCVGESRKQLYGSVANSLRYDGLVEPFSDVSTQLREHDEYAAPLADWQSCMAAAGFDVGDHDYGASYIEQAGAAALSTEGRGQTQFTAETIPAIAAADADCQESSGLYDVRESLLAGITQEIADDLGVDLEHYIAYQRALLARAQQIP